MDTLSPLASPDASRERREPGPFPADKDPGSRVAVPARPGMQIGEGRAPDGFIETCDPDTGELDLIAVWLPPGETAESLGLATFVPFDEILTDIATDLEDTAP